MRYEHTRVSDELSRILRLSIERDIAGEGKFGILFSGGLDSSILACMSAEFGEAILYTVGTAECTDLRAAAAGAARLGLPLKKIVALDDDVTSSCDELVVIFGRYLKRMPTRLELSVFSPMVMAMRNIEERTVISGQGADEEFGGYNRYAGMNAEERRYAMDRDLRMLLEEGRKRDNAVAAAYGKKLLMPFLSNEMVEFSREIEDDEKISDGERKIVLRRVAFSLGLDAAFAPKKAMQYGSGFEKVIKKRYLWKGN
jgi:asparagine synthase (glutamine-hydrolysing)